MTWPTLLLTLTLLTFQAYADTRLLDHFDTNRWGGHGKLSTEHLREGPHTLRWDATASGGLETSSLPTDWSSFSGLAFWCYSEKATAQPIHLIVTSPGSNGESDGFHAEFKVHWQGWRRLTFPFHVFTALHQPDPGWSRVTKMAIISRWAEAPPISGTVLYFDDLRLVSGADLIVDHIDRPLQTLPPLPLIELTLAETLILPTPKEIKLTGPKLPLITSSHTVCAIEITPAASAIERSSAADLSAGITTASGTALAIPVLVGSADAPLTFRLGVGASTISGRRITPPPHAEGYCVEHVPLEQGKHLVCIIGSDPVGVFYGVQSVLQLLVKNLDSTTLRAATIRDWPDFKLRCLNVSNLPGSSLAARSKFNTLTVPYWELKDWRNPSANYIAALHRQLDFALPRGLAIKQEICPYFGNKDEWIAATSDSEIEALYAAFRLSLDKGGRSLHLALDDPARAAIHPADKAVFANDLRKAQAHLTAAITHRIQRDHPDAWIGVVPRDPDYYGPGSPGVKGFYDEVGVGQGIRIFWTGPCGDITRSFTDADLRRFQADLSGRPFVLFDNTPQQQHSQGAGHPLKGLCIFDPYAADYGSLHQYAEGVHAMSTFRSWLFPEMRDIQALLIADYLWNASSYDAARTVQKALVHQAGAAALPHLLRFRQRYLGIVTAIPELFLDSRAMSEAVRQSHFLSKAERQSLVQPLADLKALLELIRTTSTNAALTQELAAHLKRFTDGIALYSSPP